MAQNCVSAAKTWSMRLCGTSGLRLQIRLSTGAQELRAGRIS
jgi:hypothetical protein